MKRIWFASLVLALLIAQGCSEDSLGGIRATATGDTGTAGSLARFAIVGNYLYVIRGEEVVTFGLLADGSTVERGRTSVATGIETLFPMQDVLFIGGQSGMYIYSIGANGVPQYLSEYQHTTACDPVVADGQYAFVTVRNGTGCGNWGTLIQDVDVLTVLDVADLTQPRVLIQHSLTNPYGLGLSADGTRLYVCDNQSGVRVYSTAQLPNALPQVAQITGITAYDVIPQGDRIIVVGPSEVAQYDCSNVQQITKLSSISIAP